MSASPSASISPSPSASISASPSASPSVSASPSASVSASPSGAPGDEDTYIQCITDGSGDDTLKTFVDGVLVEDVIVSRRLFYKDVFLSNAEFLVFDKASGNGIKVDIDNPTFGFRDLLGLVTQQNTGASKPTFATYRDTLKQYQFAATKEEFFEFHIPHDYVEGTDIFLHIHWSHTATTVTGGTVTFTYEISYSKSHNQAAFPASVTGTIVPTPSNTQYQQILSETQISASSPSGSQIDSDNLEPDGVILCRLEVTSNDITVSSGGVPDPFIHYVDIHYQSTDISTKSKAPDFYS